MKPGQRSVWAACWESRVSARRLSAWKPKGKKATRKTEENWEAGRDHGKARCCKANKGVLQARCDGKTFSSFLCFSFVTTWTEWCGNCQRNCPRWWQWQKRKRGRFKASSHTKTGGHPRNKSCVSAVGTAGAQVAASLLASIFQPKFWQWKQRRARGINCRAVMNNTDRAPQGPGSLGASISAGFVRKGRLVRPLLQSRANEKLGRRLGKDDEGKRNVVGKNLPPLELQGKASGPAPR